MSSVIGMENIIVGFIIDSRINLEYSYAVTSSFVSFLARKKSFISYVSSVSANIDGLASSIS